MTLHCAPTGRHGPHAPLVQHQLGRDSIQLIEREIIEVDLSSVERRVVEALLTEHVVDDPLTGYVVSPPLTGRWVDKKV